MKLLYGNVYEAVGTFDALIGKTLVKAEATEEVLTLTAEDGTIFLFEHDQDCCEVVYIESIVGDLQDLVGEPLLIAEGVESDQDPNDYINRDEYRDCFTWTFYKFATRKGYVDVRWLGESNGYYSESVSLKIINPGKILK